MLITLISMHSEKTAFAEPSTTPYAKRWQQSGGLQCSCIQLDSIVSEIVRKEM